MADGIDPTWSGNQPSIPPAGRPVPDPQPLSGDIQPIPPVVSPSTPTPPVASPTPSELPVQQPVSEPPVAPPQPQPIAPVPTEQQIPVPPQLQPIPSPQAAVPPTPPEPPIPPVEHIPAPAARLPQQLPVWGRVLAVVAVLTALLGGVFFLTEQGYITLGIEGLWGLSNRGKAAVTQAANSLGATPNYLVGGRFSFDFADAPSLGFLTPQPTAIPDVQATSLPLLPSNLVLNGTFTQVKTATASRITGELSLEGPADEIDDLGPAFEAGAPVPFEMISTEQEIYLRQPNEQWIRLSRNDLASLGLSSFDWPGVFRFIATNSGDLTRTRGLERVEGERAKSYRFARLSAVPFEGLFAATPSIEGTVSGLVKIGTRTKQPYELTVNGDSSLLNNGGTFEADIAFQQFGAQSDVVLPQPSELSTVSLTNWLADVGIGSLNSVASRDARRKADLRKIALALAEYAAAAKPFGYPKTEGVVRLDQAVDVQTALRPHLETLPTDPDAPARYYGYSSDGTTFRLSAVLEDTTDATGIQQGDLLLYVIETR